MDMDILHQQQVSNNTHYSDSYSWRIMLAVIILLPLLLFDYSLKLIKNKVR